MANPAIQSDEPEEEDIFAVPDDAADEAATLRGIEDFKAGRTASHEAVMRWVASWGTDKPLPRPKWGE
ncbi:CopG family transcriptional regulator [Brevundimonas sp.]